nr:type II secretion system F family protein [Kineosporia babensis]
MIAGLALIFVALAGLGFLAVGALTGSGRAQSSALRRIADYSTAAARPSVTVSSAPEAASRLGDSPLTRSAVGLMSRVARTGRVEGTLDSRLEAAGFPLRPGEWMLLHVSAAVGASLLLAVLAQGQVAATVLGLLLGLAVPWAVLLAARARREARFLAQLPDTLQLLAGSLTVGHSLPQAMDTVVREAHPPIRGEFNRALVETRLGLAAEDALDGVAERTQSRDFAWVVMAIRIQREVGGNLAELLTSVADTLRERERLRRQVAALSAEGRLSGMILGALPVVFAGYLLLARPEYIDPLFSTPLGIGLLGLGVLSLGAGGVWMAKLIRVDV